MEFNIFHFDTFERLGILDTYQEAERSLNYHDHSKLDLIVDATPQNIEWFITNGDDIFLTDGLGKVRGYMVEIAQYKDESKTQIIVSLFSLSYLASFRDILKETVYSGNVELIMRSYVNTNMINPTDSNRRITNLVLGPIAGISATTNESYNFQQLDVALWAICKKYDITYEIFADIPNKRFSFEVWQGVDRSTNQSVRDAVIFSKEFDNILTQNYVDDKTDYRNAVIVAGEGEDTERKYLTIGGDNKGRKRRELFVDARDLQSTTKQTVVEIDEEGNETETTVDVQMSTAAYNQLLTERGNEKVAEFIRTQSFETDIDFNSQFKIFVDYNNGDKVTIRNDELGVAVHTRIVVLTEVWNKDGYELGIEFGSSVPTLISKIKKAVNN